MNKKIKSILIELDENLEKYETIINNLTAKGFVMKSKKESSFILKSLELPKTIFFIVSKEKLIIFDFDGVLINSEKNMELTWNKTIKNLKEYNIPFSEYKKILAYHLKNS